MSKFAPTQSNHANDIREKVLVEGYRQNKEELLEVISFPWPEDIEWFLAWWKVNYEVLLPQFDAGYEMPQNADDADWMEIQNGEENREHMSFVFEELIPAIELSFVKKWIDQIEKTRDYYEALRFFTYAVFSKYGIEKDYHVLNALITQIERIYASDELKSYHDLEKHSKAITIGKRFVELTKSNLSMANQ